MGKELYFQITIRYFENEKSKYQIYQNKTKSF